MVRFSKSQQSLGVLETFITRLGTICVRFESSESFGGMEIALISVATFKWHRQEFRINGKEI